MYNKKVGPTIEPSEALVSLGHFYKDPPPLPPTLNYPKQSIGQK